MRDLMIGGLIIAWTFNVILLCIVSALCKKIGSAEGELKARRRRKNNVLPIGE